MLYATQEDCQSICRHCLLLVLSGTIKKIFFGWWLKEEISYVRTGCMDVTTDDYESWKETCLSRL